MVNPLKQFVLKKNNEILFAGIASSSSIINFSQLSRQGEQIKEEKKDRQNDLGSRFLGNLLSLGNDLLNTSNHVERLFRKIIIFTIQHTLPTIKIQNINTSPFKFCSGLGEKPRINCV